MPPSEELAAGMRAMVEAASAVDLEKASTAREATVDGVVDLKTGQSDIPIADRSVAEQDDILARVARFLDPKTAGPTYLIPARGKLFVGRLLTSQEALEVERMGAMPMNSQMTSGQYLTLIIGELLKSIYGWVPEQSPRAQILKAHRDDPARWPKLEEVEWLATRDPYLRQEEIDPLYEAYVKWKASVIVGPEEIRFYFSRMT